MEELRSYCTHWCMLLKVYWDMLRIKEYLYLEQVQILPCTARVSVRNKFLEEMVEAASRGSKRRDRDSRYHKKQTGRPDR